MRALAAALIVALASAASAEPRQRSVRSRTPSAWSAPKCDTVRGLPSFRYTRDAGDTVADNEFAPTTNIAPSAIVLSDVPNRLFALFDDAVYESHDAGCNWSVRGDFSGLTTIGHAQLISARGGRAYAWNDRTIIGISQQGLSTSATPERLAMIAANPADADHLFAFAYYGTPYESLDGGATWTARTRVADAIFYDAAVDPRHFRHAIVSGTRQSLWETRDGGFTWQRISVPEHANFFSVSFSEADPNVVWLAGVSLGEGRQTLYRSIDNGVTFAPVLRSSSLVPFANSPALAPHPTDPDVVAFGSLNGLAIFDASSSTTRIAELRRSWFAVAWSPVPDIIYLAGPDQTIVFN